MFKKFYALRDEIKTLDPGTQFKIYDRVIDKAREIDDEKEALVKLIELILEETKVALLENGRRHNRRLKKKST